ncbi:MAG TPA: ProQ/FinO family protein [Aquabacterium sp.]|nr:ProQ/FinO family protein [Aquabacterium sp.]
MSDTPEQSPKAGQMTPAECGTKLKELFPALFGQDKPLPLKLRIQADIQERAPGVFTKPVLSAFLRRHTGSYAYLIGLTKATHRFDLDGQPAGELTDEHRQAASDELTRRRTLKNEQRAQEEQAIRERAGVLRDFERTTLTPANFCALKGIAPDALDALLAQARQDRIDHPELLAPKRHPDRRDHRADKGRPGAGRPHNSDRRGAHPQRNKPAPKTSA